MAKQPVFEQFKKYHFEIKHLLVVFVVLMLFQLSVGLVQKLSLRNFLSESQKWYQQDFAERTANLTASSMELILETSVRERNLLADEAQKISQAFNIILSQQLLQQHVQEVCILVTVGDSVVAIDNGHVLFSYLFKDNSSLPPPDRDHRKAIAMYKNLKNSLTATEQTHSVVSDNQVFHVFVPFVPKGEYFGALYMRSRPEFGFVTSGILSSTHETNLIFSSLIFFGLLAMFYISSSGTGKLQLILNDQPITKPLEIEATGGWQQWQTFTVDSVYLPAGTLQLKVLAQTGGFNLGYLEFVLVDTSVEQHGAFIPVSERVYLAQNYPNPFNRSTTIPVLALESANVKLEVFNATGSLVKQLFRGTLERGSNRIIWDGTDNFNDTVSTGVYFLRIAAGNAVKTKPMVFLK